VCAKNKKFDNDSIIVRLNLKHNNKYDYSLLNYVNMNTKVKIICPEHGVFEQTPAEHLQSGCSKCRNIINSTSKLIEKSKEINDDKYDYSLTIFIKANIKVKFICKYHNYIFEQTPNNHISKKHGCPLCGNVNRRLSRIKEISINKFNGNQVVPSFNSIACKIFDKISIEKNVHIQHAMNGGEYYIEKLGFWLDGYDKENNIAYEYDEKHHFDKYNNLLKSDIKRQIEIENFLKCEFIRIKYSDNIL
jgi:rubrerythrin